jgi:hypothetical protein
MTVVRKFAPDVRLKKLLVEPGGMSAAQALDRASGNLESIREACETAIDAKIEHLMELVRSQEAGRFDAIYRVSNEVFAESGAFGLAELSVAAHSLCSLLGAGDQTKVPTAAIVVHIDSMRLLRKPDLAGDAAARGAVLAGLRNMTKRLATQG